MLMAMVRRAHLALRTLRDEGFQEMVEFMHAALDPMQKDELHHYAMKSFKVQGKHANRWLLHLSCPTFVASLHLTNPTSLGNNENLFKIT